MKSKRVKAKVSQARQIKEKRGRGGVKPVMGRLLRDKTSGVQQTTPLHMAAGHMKPDTYTDSQVGFIFIVKQTQ